MKQEWETKISLEDIAQQLRRSARDIENVAWPNVRVTGTIPKQHPWDDLRDIAYLVDRLTAMRTEDHQKRSWSVSRLREIADSLEDMYEQSRDY